MKINEPSLLPIVNGSMYNSDSDVTGTIVFGSVRADVVRLAIVHDDGTVVDPLISEQGPLPKQRWFATFVAGQTEGVRTLIVYDATGRELGREDWGWPRGT